MSRKLVLCVVDSLREDMLSETVAAGRAPLLGELIERGMLISDCVSSFPSVTPVCTSEIATGVGPAGHWIAGMNWYHRAERRYVEYGSSLEASRSMGLFRALYDVVYNLNMSHLSPEVETIFERLGDAGLRSACTPFLIYRGRTRHELGLEGLLRRVAVAANFRHATWGPDELFYGELYSSRRVPCKPTLARPGTRDEYSACVGRELAADDLNDFLLFSLPDNDSHSHRYGPAAQAESIERADASLTELVEAHGGIDDFLAGRSLIVTADHAHTEVEHELPLVELLRERWRVADPRPEEVSDPELAVSPSSRAASVYLLGPGEERAERHAELRTRLLETAGVDLVCWLAGPDGEPIVRAGVGAPELGGGWAVIDVGNEPIRFRSGGELRDRRGRCWELDGNLGLLGGQVSGGELDAPLYPDVLSRVWGALCSPYAGDVLVSNTEGYECVDWGGTSHAPGGSHGSLLAGDSLVPLLLVGMDPSIPARREQWAIRDVAGLVLEHFGLEGPA
ncbi:MAG: alkaline phosphatase family protein [Solirubrobacterales bacterium]|nr:alkaline phosphatase family protein [Solirubrobacterales bacterium]